MRQSVQGTLGDPPPKEMGSEAILRLDHPLIRPVLEARGCEACTPLRSCTRRPRANRVKRLQATFCHPLLTMGFPSALHKESVYVCQWYACLQPMQHVMDRLLDNNRGTPR